MDERGMRQTERHFGVAEMERLAQTVLGTDDAGFRAQCAAGNLKVRWMHDILTVWNRARTAAYQSVPRSCSGTKRELAQRMRAFLAVARQGGDALTENMAHLDRTLVAVIAAGSTPCVTPAPSPVRPSATALSQARPSLQQARQPLPQPPPRDPFWEPRAVQAVGVPTGVVVVDAEQCAALAAGRACVLLRYAVPGAAQGWALAGAGGAAPELALTVGGRAVGARALRIGRRHAAPYVTGNCVDITGALQAGANVVAVGGALLLCRLTAEYCAVRTLADVRAAVRARASSDLWAAPAPADADLSVAEERVSLLCPLALRRIALPARGTACRHATCFDLDAFLTLQHQQGFWECPICAQPCPAHTLRVDPAFARILAHTRPDATFAMVGPDGSVLADSESGTGNGNGTSPAPPSQSPPAAAVTADTAPSQNEYIVLDDDEEEEEDKGGEDNAEPQQSAGGDSTAVLGASPFGAFPVVPGIPPFMQQPQPQPQPQPSQTPPTQQDGHSESTAFVLDDSDTDNEPSGHSSSDDDDDGDYSGGDSDSDSDDGDGEDDDDDDDGFVFDCTRYGDAGDGEAVRRMLHELELQRYRVYDLLARSRTGRGPSTSPRPAQRRHLPPNP